MSITRKELDAAAQQGLLTPEQIEPLLAFLNRASAVQPRFTGTHVVYYLGGLIAMAALSLFLHIGWNSFGGWGLATLALVYALAGWKLTDYWLHRRQLRIPAGVSAAFTVSVIPLLVYGVQAELIGWQGLPPTLNYLGSSADTQWLPAQLGAMLCALVLFRAYKLPFIMMPMTVACWIFALNVSAAGSEIPWLPHITQETASMIAGIVMVLIAVWLDRTTAHNDCAFWWYVVGVLAFWLGLTWQDHATEWARFGYLCVNLMLLFAGALLGRRIFVVCAGLGVAGYLGYLSYEVFENSIAFPIALTFIGLGIMYCGVLWQRYEQRHPQRWKRT